VFNFFFNIKIKKHEMISHQDNGFHPTPCRLWVSIIFYVLEQLFVASTVTSICAMSSGYYGRFEWANGAWTYPVYYPLMIYGWVACMGSIFTLCKINSFQRRGLHGGQQVHQYYAQQEQALMQQPMMAPQMQQNYQAAP
jgi:hypothetical protein